jgi:predicted DNA-binding transcriptional regulator AlpA
MPPTLDLVGPSEIAEMLGISRRTAFRYVARPGFPEPVGRVGRTTVWKRAAVERWAKKTLPLTEGRPPQ